MTNEFRGLVAAIIKQAVIDYKKAIQGIEKTSQKIANINHQLIGNRKPARSLERNLSATRNALMEFKRIQKEIELFFDSEWFLDLCEVTNLDANYIKKRVLEGFNDKRAAL